MTDFPQLVREARLAAKLTQRELAERVGTSQSAIAAIESGDANPTVDTLSRCLAAAGFAAHMSLHPRAVLDPVIALYKRDVDRTLLRANLRKSVDERLRTLGEWQHNVAALQLATRTAKRTLETSPQLTSSRQQKRRRGR